MLFQFSLHVVGNHVCLVVLCPETARRESRCPLYRVSPFSCTKSHKLKHNMARSHPIPSRGPLLTTNDPVHCFVDKPPHKCSVLDSDSDLNCFPACFPHVIGKPTMFGHVGGCSA